MRRRSVVWRWCLVVRPVMPGRRVFRGVTVMLRRTCCRTMVDAGYPAQLARNWHGSDDEREDERQQTIDHLDN